MYITVYCNVELFQCLHVCTWGTSYQTPNENIFLSCLLMRTIFPKSLFTQIWIKKLRNHATRCSLRKQSPLLVLHCKERFAGYTWCVKSKWEMSSKTHGMCLTLSRTPSQFFVHASIHFPAPCLMLNKKTCG